MTGNIRTRQESNPDFHWDLTGLFADDQAFEAQLEEVTHKLNTIEVFRGRLGESSQVLYEALSTILDLGRQVGNLGVYAHLKSDQDKGNATYQAMTARAGKLWSDYAAQRAFVEPELLALPEGILARFLAENKDLGLYRQYLDNIVRTKDHVLPQEMELLLAQGGEFFAGNSQVYSYLNNADLVFPTIHDENGQAVTLTNGNFVKFLESTDRSVRQAAFEAYYDVYHQFGNTMAAILGNEVKKNNYLAKVHHYGSARQAALSKDNVPEAVYDTLIDCVHQRTDLLHRYVHLRKKLLGLQAMEMYDMYTSILGEPPIKFNYEQAQHVVLQALQPLGADYVAIIQKAFDEKWIDVFENKGKRSGAYSSGSYDSNPYILMNFQEGIQSLYTLIHELGHSAHSYLTNTHQPYIYSHYPIFLAEIASTTNENLLTAYLLQHYSDKKIQGYILNQFLDRLKATVYRQTQFAEFEHLIYQADQSGTALTAAFLNQSYQDLNARYYGDEVNSTSEIAYEWSRIPHFYMNYYVFQYATGFAAATAFSERILSGDLQQIEAYLGFLKSGNAKYPLDTMLEAGLDMTQSDYIQATLAVFERRLDEFESLIAAEE